ncbi:steryl acetyl hydrolase [Aquimarina sp. AD1]|uniref:alpha/beta hydrolase fold domain-containing protein n=1 Tax=Aquimarina sp. (strain AD1) TaxID=1714848 RepID=UPI000E524A40|nr:alpha/beta hydrolase fold domain-containing protein [Aquimarina sp. AD1]AXT55164.1 steryl acetyl hydrolase [Aquimarina sp. AD1]RKN14118.1 steryl acetyl hydrolase [Aquimarina sp. AD1]
MKQSFTYYLALMVIKLKKVKKSFSKDPIDFKRLRKEDVYKPKGGFFKKHLTRNFKISDSSITEIQQNKEQNKLLIFIHGGAFISGPAKHHWDTIKAISKQTDFTIWLCNYPKAPEHKITEISDNIDSMYRLALETYTSDQICLIGDSAGGTLITTLTQRIISNNLQIPKKIILISPVMDASMSNTDINDVDLVDPMLSKLGILSAKKMCVGNLDLKNPMISPLYGSFEQFPETILYIAERDIAYPDQKLAVEKFKAANVNLKLVEGTNMPHIWPLLPVMKEAKISLQEIISQLNKDK